MEKYIYEPNLNLDYDYLKSLALKSKSINANIQHHRSVYEDPYMTSILEKLPFLTQIYNFYNTSGGKTIPLHVDAKRNAAFNIPILNTNNSNTIFCNTLGEVKTEYVENRVYNLIKSDVTEVFRFTLLKPTLINTSVPHMVVNNGSENRIIISWSVSNKYTFLEAVELFKKYEKNNI